MRITGIIIMSVFISSAALAQNRPSQLVCFEQKGLEQSLSKVVNAQQFLNNDRSLQSGSCTFVQIPAGSTARYLGIYQSDGGFLYPIYRIAYSTTGQRMYAADGIFRDRNWNVRKQRGTNVSVIWPVSCGVLDGYLQMNNRLPKYMRIPDLCQEEVVE